MITNPKASRDVSLREDTPSCAIAWANGLFLDQHPRV